jgi:NADPH-dependent 2,4-dienoyl-CoA reductase/sulfur reductase-like enzyme
MKVVIIGNGISGITTARWVRKNHADAEIVVVSEEHDYFFSRTALMYIFMGHMRLVDTQPYENWFWQKNRIQLLKARVESIDYAKKSLNLKQGTAFTYDKLVLALGSKPNKFGWKGQDLTGVQGMYHLSDLEGMEAAAARGVHHAVVVGGGLIGIEMAEMWHARHVPVTFLVRESSFWNLVLPAEESAMINRHIRAQGIDLRLSSELDAVLDENNDGIADAVVTKNGEKIAADFVGLTVGVSPNIDFLKSSELATGRGITVDEYLQTNQPDVFAIGDCAELSTPQPGRRGIEAVWYTGRQMGETVAQTICGNPTRYVPQLWFNSAKFFDIEYQVYGDVQAKLPENHSTLYWEHANGEKAVRINYDKNTLAVVGFNLMGIRYRHAVCEKWILDKTPIKTVLEHLGLANFDPEFFKEYEAAVVAQYNQQTGENIQLKTARSLTAVQRFLRKIQS